jgi:uncharacterized protein
MTEPMTVPRQTIAKDVVDFRGHRMVRALHPTTIEVTTEEDLTEEGDCIIGVGAAKGCAQLDPRVKEGLRRADSRVTVRIIAGPQVFVLHASSDPRLELSHPHDIVIRKSGFTSDRTLAVRADASSRDVPRPLIRLLRDPGTLGRLEIEVETG